VKKYEGNCLFDYETDLDDDQKRYGFPIFGQLEIPADTRKIGNYVFKDCTGLKGNIIIPDLVTSIGKYAFNGCTSLNGTIKIGSSVQTIDKYAFSQCNNIRGNLTIPQSVTNIGFRAFQLCEKISSIDIYSDILSFLGESFAAMDHNTLIDKIAFVNITKNQKDASEWNWEDR
jgi:hypothetical protein